MKILHVIARMAARDGGPPKACFEMARAVARLGHDVSIFSTNMDGGGELDVPVGQPVLRDGVEHRYFPIGRPRFWGTSWEMARALETKIPEVDVVHMHSLYFFHDWVVGRVCSRANVPYILRPHGTLDPYIYRRHRWRKAIVEHLFQNRVTRNAAALHFTTEEEGVLARPYGFGVPGVVIPNGLEVDEYESLPGRGGFRAGHPEIGEGPIVLFLGRLNFKKGLDILVPAFASILKQRPDARLVLAGPDDGLRAQTEEWVHQHGLTSSVVFTGMVEGKDKLALLADSDLFVLPSYSENFGIAVIEAMASGLPVAVSDKVNIWREISAADAGWVTPVAIEPFEEAMMDALANPEAARRRGQNGRRMVAEKYQWPQIAHRLEQTYRSVAAGPCAV